MKWDNGFRLAQLDLQRGFPMILSYRRVSQDDQQHGPRAQSDRIEAWRANHNSEPFQDFFDDGVSGSVPLAKRPQGAALLEALKQEAGERLVVVAKLDRLFRSVADAAMTMDTWSKAGIKLVSLAENFDMTSPYGKAMAHIMSALAELERSMIRERTRAALQAKKRRGERVGTVPYGSTVDGNGKLVDDPQEQAVIAEIKSCYAAGLRMRRIAQRLNERGFVAKKGGPWGVSSVAAVLKRNGA
jgi:DNA invertase Pin-like site-specific DNA recombinase